MTDTDQSFRSIYRLQSSVLPIRAFYWHEDGDTPVRELTDNEIQSEPVPEGFQVRTTPAVLLQDQDEGFSLITTLQQYDVDNLPLTNNGYYVYGVLLETREAADALIDALIKKRDSSFPA